MACCVDTIPLSGIDSIIIEANFRNILNAERRDTASFIVVKQLKNSLGPFDLILRLELLLGHKFLN
jgi:hypothetical protein